MKAAVSCAILAASFLASPAYADCPIPRAPDSIPDGKTATEAEMLAAMQAFKAYNDDVTAFGTCLEEETRSKSLSSSQIMQLKTLQTRKHNAAVQELQQKAKLFNEQVRIFKAR